MHRLTQCGFAIAPAVIVALALVVPGSVSAHSEDSGRLSVFAAASLTETFPALSSRPQYSFAGSDQLSFQIQQGAAADVFAAASPKYPEQLYKLGLVEKPIPFVTNTLGMIVPKSNPAGIHSVTDLTKPGVKVVIGDAGVPVGSYTLTVLRNLGISAGVLANVVSRELDVKGIVAKVALGEADAAFVYVTDVRPVRGKVLAFALRESAQPHIVYEVAVVKAGKHRRAAYRFVTSLIRPAWQHRLVGFGFGPRPKPAP